jgi:hypothetical protein
MFVFVRACVFRPVLRWVGRVPGARQPHPGAGERVPHACRDVDEVGEDLDLQATVQGVLDQVCEVGVQGWFAADELHHPDAEVGALVDHAQPVRALHGAMRSGGAGLGIAVDALQLAFAGDLQPDEVQAGRSGDGGWFGRCGHLFLQVVSVVPGGAGRDQGDGPGPRGLPAPGGGLAASGPA